MTLGAARNPLNLTNSLSKRLNSTTALSTLMCPFGVGFMKDSDYLLSVPETRFLLHYFVCGRSSLELLIDKPGHPVMHAEFCNV